jgi:putative hydrolase of the HAD superfamily
MRYDAVIFDLFGTLVEPLTHDGAREYQAVMSAALGIAPADFHHYWSHVTFEQRSTGGFRTIEENIAFLCRELGVPEDDARIRAAANARYAMVARSLAPRADTLATLARIKKLGYKTGLISDCSPDVPELFTATPMAPFIDAPFFSSKAGVRKPDPRIYALVCAALDVAPDRCLFVGDGDSNELTGARSFGMDAVLIRVPGDCGVRRFDDPWTGPRIDALAKVLPMLV